MSNNYPTKRVDLMKPPARRTVATAALSALVVWAMGGALAAAGPLEFGVDRSNMGTQWTQSWPQEPKAAPFLGADKHA